jgi:HPt (histidine-containing phosphotransfer) domain-containing protein
MPSEGDCHRSTLSGVPEFAALLEAYVRYLSGVEVQLQDAVRAGNWDDVRRLAHRLRGTGASYGFPQITELAAECERAISRDVGEATNLAERLAAVLRAACDEN